MAKFNIMGNEYELDNRDSLKEIIFQTYNEDFFRNSTTSDIEQIPKCVLRTNLVENIISNRGADISYRKKLDNYFDTEANRYSLLAAGKIYTAYAFIDVLMNAKQTGDKELVNKVSLALCILTNAGMSVIH